MDVKERPNHKAYLKTLSRMTPEEKLIKVFELTQLGRELFFQGLRDRFPEKSESELRELYLERLKLCYNRNY
jgi:hypothetical protein